MPDRKTPLFVVYGGDDFDGNAFRVVERCPPRLEDFLSYERLGRQYKPRKRFQATGVSMYGSFEQAAAAAKRWGIGQGVASFELTGDVVWTSSSRHGHIAAWATPATLLARVLQCVEINDD